MAVVTAVVMAVVMVLTVGVMAAPRKVVIPLRGAIHPPEGPTEESVAQAAKP